MASKTHPIDPKGQQGTMPSVPPGYVTVSGPDGRTYVVPDFMVPSLHQVFRGYRHSTDLNAMTASGTVSLLYFCGFAEWIGHAETLGSRICRGSRHLGYAA